MKVIKGDPLKGSRLKIGLIVSRFNDDVTKRLWDGAMVAFGEAGVPDRSVTLFSVPGAFEIPGAAQRMAATGKFDAIVCLGAVIRGETAHFELVADAAQQGVLRVALDSGIPVTFGVLATETREQALARASEGAPMATDLHAEWDNKGYEAARSALEMADAYRKLR